MNSFFRTLSLVSFSLSLILLTGCGMSPGSRSGGVTMTTQAYTSVTTTTFSFVSPLSCSLKIKGITATATATAPVAAVAGEVVSIEVTASGGIALGGSGRYSFKRVRFNEVDHTGFTTNSTNQSKASLTITMPAGISAIMPLLAEVALVNSGGEEIVPCSAAIALGTNGLTLNADKLVALPSQSISINAVLNTSTSGTIYYVGTTNYDNMNIQVFGNTITVSQTSAKRTRAVLTGAEITVKAYNSSSTVIATSKVNVFFAPELKCDFAPLPAKPKHGVPFTIQMQAINPTYLTPTEEPLIYSGYEVGPGYEQRVTYNSGIGTTSGLNLTMFWDATALAVPTVNSYYVPIKLKARRILGEGEVIEECSTQSKFVEVTRN